MKPLIVFFCCLFLIFSANTFYAIAEDSSLESADEALIFLDTKLDLEYYLNTAILFKASGENERALEVLSKAESQFRNDRRFVAYLARFNYLLGNSQKALDIFAELKNKNWDDFIYLGLIYEDLGQINKAISSYLASLKSRDNSIALFRLAKIYRKQQRYREAISYFKRLIKADSSIRLSYYYLGECLLKKAKHDEAYKYLSKAIKFYPESGSVAKLFDQSKQALGKDFFIAKKNLKDKQRKRVESPSYVPKDGTFDIAIGLAKELKQFSFSSRGNFVISGKGATFSGQANVIYTVTLRDKKLILQGYQDKKEYAVFSDSLSIFYFDSINKVYPFYLFDITYGKGNFWHKTVDRAYRGAIEVLVKKGTLTLVNRLSIEEYLYGVLSAEIPYASGKEALKAQAVAARTLVFRNRGRHRHDGFDFCADVHCQVYQGMSAETLPTTSAVEETRGQILEFNDKPIETFYHSNCGGCLASDVFGKEEYLVNKIDFNQANLPRFAYERERWFIESPETFCSKNSSGYRWQRIYDSEDFLIAFGFELKEVKNFFSHEIGECSHHKKVELISTKKKKSLSGGLAIRDYLDKLRSSAFMVEIKSSANKLSEMFIIWGAGFGHGTGLCQEGAIGMADQGYNYQEILHHYYPKTKINTVY
ncbi:MAG: SpoIID/LytB domain-containing protein [Candidatus Omnitrophica bacterium]|nr:SpoIID/LytB domain-containing protein [Candidatus Omnitrophota bacterium]